MYGEDGYYPYLETVATYGEENYDQYSSSEIFTKSEIIEKLKNSYPNISITDEKGQIKIIEYTDGKRAKTVKFGNVELAGVEVRNIFDLRSAYFSITEKDGKFMFDVLGYGHGVGMSQTGADALAIEGKNYYEIINHYYSNIKIENIE